MKSIDFLFIGKSKNPACAALEHEYHKKICQHVRGSQLEILRDAPGKLLEAQRRTQDTANIVARVDSSAHLVICDETGLSLDTTVFARKLRGWYELGQRVVFAVGGAYGLDFATLPKSTAILRLSDLTFTHEIARVVLLEQVYRALNIWAGTAYHHD